MRDKTKQATVSIDVLANLLKPLHTRNSQEGNLTPIGLFSSMKKTVHI